MYKHSPNIKYVQIITVSFKLYSYNIFIFNLSGFFYIFTHSNIPLFHEENFILSFIAAGSNEN